MADYDTSELGSDATGADEPVDFAEAFTDRLASLARAHSLLTHGSWDGADLADIVATALAAFIDEGRPIEIAGDPVMIPPSTTITLSLMLHELATNAAKYGALSVPQGRLAVRWSAVDAGSAVAIDLDWQEDGGPPVSPPKRSGFGSRLLAGSAEQIGGQLETDYAASGLRCRLRFSVQRIY